MATKPALKTVEQELDAMDAGKRLPDYESYRAALLAFYRVDSPWMIQKLKNLEHGDSLTFEDRRIIDGLIVAGERMPK